jgi:hypothetical protein
MARGTHRALHRTLGVDVESATRAFIALHHARFVLESARKACLLIGRRIKALETDLAFEALGRARGLLVEAFRARNAALGEGLVVVRTGCAGLSSLGDVLQQMVIASHRLLATVTANCTLELTLRASLASA